MREIRSYGSVRGVRSNPYSYRDIQLPLRSSALTRRRPLTLAPSMNDASFFAHASASAQLWSKSRDSSSAS
jgi:hypothetical protein